MDAKATSTTPDFIPGNLEGLILEDGQGGFVLMIEPRTPDGSKLLSGLYENMSHRSAADIRFSFHGVTDERPEMFRIHFQP